jgi:hypothetical protein
MSRNTMEILDANPETWAREVADYAAQDAKTALPRKPVVLVGGQRVTLWQDLEQSLSPHPILMRGLGDAIVEDIIHYYPQLVGDYQPRALVVMLGNGEFFLRASKSAEEVIGAIQTLEALDDSHQVTERFIVFAPLKTPRHTRDHPKIAKTAELLKAWADTRKRVIVLDANPLLCDRYGAPRARYFLGDGVNLNEHGYLRLAVLLKTQLEADELAQQELDKPP